jgi:hypothetical protein
MFRRFKNFKFGAETQQRIDQANEIIEKFTDQELVDAILDEERAQKERILKVIK